MNIIPTDGRQGVFAINVFTVRPENQQPLIDCIRDAAALVDIPGLLSMYLLRSADGTQVINHMHWASEDAFERATASNEVIAETKRRVGALIEGASPGLYEVVDVSR